MRTIVNNNMASVEAVYIYIYYLPIIYNQFNMYAKKRKALVKKLTL